MNTFIILLFITSGIYFTLKLKFKNFNPILTLKALIKKNDDIGITPFESLCISLAGRIGVGSLSGVAISILQGGIGSIFWMWITTIICSSNTMLESMISVKYRKKINKNTYEGGPFYYIDLALKNKKFALIYAILFVLIYLGAFLPIQTNTISKILFEVMHINKYIIAGIITLITSLIIYKNIKQIAEILSKIIPFIAITYIITCLIIILKNVTVIDNILINIIKEAFNKNSIITGFTIGTLKSIFSTEAGLGTGSIASSSSSNTNELEQGLVQVFGIFFDTFIVSTLTAFIILLSPFSKVNLLDINGIEITQMAFIYQIGKIGGLILIISIIVFAFSTIISSYYYIEVALKYIFKYNIKKIYNISILIIIFLSTIISPNIIWDLIDKGIIILAIINTIALFLIINKKNDKIK